VQEEVAQRSVSRPVADADVPRLVHLAGFIGFEDVSDLQNASSSGIGSRQRRAQAIASSMFLTCHSQNPAFNSFVSANGPSMTFLVAPAGNYREL